MIARVRTPQKHVQDLSFSPFYPNKIACASGQFYGLAGSGALFIITFPERGEPVVQSFPWSDCLFAATWSERNEHLIVAGAGDGSILLYDTNNAKGPISAVKEHSREVSSVNWCQMRVNSHLFLTASWDLSIGIWDGEGFKPVSKLPKAHGSLIYDVQASPLVQGLFASCSGDGSVRMWSMNTASHPMAAWKAHDAEVLSLDWCKYDQHTLATAGTDGLVKIWDTRNTTHPKMVLSGHQYAVKRVRFSPHQSSLLATSSYDFTVKTWDFLKHNHCTNTYSHHSEFVCGLDFNLHRPMQVASGSWDETVAMWNLNPIP